jgi:hypothetical protein
VQGLARTIGPGTLLTGAADGGAPPSSYVVTSESAVLLAVADADQLRLLARAAWVARRGPRSAKLMPAANG